MLFMSRKRYEPGFSLQNLCKREQLGDERTLQSADNLVEFQCPDYKGPPYDSPGSGISTHCLCHSEGRHIPETKCPTSGPVLPLIRQSEI